MERVLKNIRCWEWKELFDNLEVLMVLMVFIWEEENLEVVFFYKLLMLC